jgi:hypothetical protein
MVSMGLKYLTIRSIKLGLELLLGHVERQVGDPYGLVLRMESVCLGKSRIGDGNSAGMAGTLGIEPLRPIIIASASAWIVRTGRGSAVKLSTVPSSLLAVGIASELDVSLDEVLDVGKAKVLVADEGVDATGRSDGDVRVRILVAKHFARRCARHGVPECLGRSRKRLRS